MAISRARHATSVLATGPAHPRVHHRRSGPMGRPGPVPFFEPARTAVSVRVVPLPTVVVDALAAHPATFPSESSNLHQRTRGLIQLRHNVAVGHEMDRTRGVGLPRSAPLPCLARVPDRP